MNGKIIRLSRILNPSTGNTVIVPLDHGLTHGSIPGIRIITDTLSKLDMRKIDAVVLHKGFCTKQNLLKLQRKALIIQLSGIPDFCVTKNPLLLMSVKEAVCHGADAVALNLNFGTDQDDKSIADMVRVAADCNEYGMPLLCMLGDQLIGNNDKKIEIIHKAIRLCEEVGVDLIKVPISFFQNDKQNIANDVSIPIIVAGGDYMGSDDDVLKSTELIMKKGARGVAMGRNIFQRENPVDLLEKIHKLIHGKV